VHAWIGVAGETAVPACPWSARNRLQAQ